MTLQEYEECYWSGQKGKPVENLCGRVIRGTRPEHFTTLTDDANRQFVLVTGPEGLSDLIGLPGYESLLVVGHTPEHILRKVNEGNAYKLAVFPRIAGALPATWDTLAQAIRPVYPQASQSIDRWLQRLRMVSFAEIEHDAGFRFSEIDKDPADPRYMTYERFLASSHGLVETRAFLYYTVHLRELFSGDGYTYTYNGKRGVQEYITPNVPLVSFGEYSLLDLPVVVP